ncbi:hypothetical protein [Actinopolymorpha alba]|uniref:hypothetical protein n=1 Tax=Actinopolymorpha alba TaxID=533267 RepID=UPI0012F6C208|nr:hypothetical protein [Actinopolymorpha alba]
MTGIFGPNTREVLHMISHLDGLGSEEIGTVAAAWKEHSRPDRAAAWAAIWQATTPEERQAILDAAALARREAMDVALRATCSDWAFWAAAWDAAAAVAACDRIDRRHHRVLAEPLATVLPWLSLALPDRVEVSGLRAAITHLGDT